MSDKCRSYCLTFFTEPKLKNVEQLRYLIVGIETCPTTNKKHYQCYVELNAPQRPSYIKKLFEDKTIHIEARRGTRDQARTYCMKENNFTEYGNWSAGGQGSRTDLKSIVTDMTNGTKTLTEVMLESPETYCRYRGGLRDIDAIIKKKNSTEFRNVNVIFITGPTGTGKTKLAMQNSTFKIEGSELQWFDGYTDDQTITIDEYDNNVPITKLLNLLDGYQLRLPIKGGFTYANWKTVYITSNLRVDELHANAKPAHRAALFRRITKIVSYWPCPDGT